MKIGFLAVQKRHTSPKITIERVFFDSDYIVELKPLDNLTSLLVLKNGTQRIKGSFHGLSAALKRFNIPYEPEQLKLF